MSSARACASSGFCLRICAYLSQRRDLLQRHPARDAPAHGGLLIQTEIDPRGGPQNQADLVQFAAFGHLPRLRQVGMAADARQLGGDALGRQNEIDRTGRDRAHRHGGPLRRFRILRESHAARRLDCLQPVSCRPIPCRKAPRRWPHCPVPPPERSRNRRSGAAARRLRSAASAAERLCGWSCSCWAE